MRLQSAAVFVIAMVPVMTAAQQFLAAPPGAAVDPNTRFEVAAIKVGDASGQMMVRMMPARFDATNVPAGLLLRQALQKPDYQIVGLSGWADTERYSINAKAPDGTPPAAMNVLLLNLLKDRFGLATHLETRELPVFNLVMARADGRLGPDLKPTSAECRAILAERAAVMKTAAAGGPPPPLPSFPGPNDPLPCGFLRTPPGSMAGSGRPIAQIVPTLADFVGRPVIDKTGLTDRYDFSLKFIPTGRVAGPFGPPPGAPEPVVDPDAPSLFTALQEQLGLRLDNARGPVEVVVIDRFEKPTPD
jgi:uncharacterized protein (TIGR03435 family)